MTGFLLVVAALHVGFMVAELFPWPMPVLLRVASRKLPAGQQLSESQRTLVATVVHNAGIYNGIIAVGLLWSAWGGDPSGNVARVLLAGAASAGLFGTATMKSRLTALQAALGLAGLYLMNR
jgi:putative membrane protein